MRPEHLEITGFMAFKDRIVIDFGDLDLFVIGGPTGAGKSSILDAMLFALYGKAPRIGRQEIKHLISHGAKRMAVKLDFSVRGRKYRIARSTGLTSSKVLLERLENGKTEPLAENVREVERAIEKILGLPYEYFIQAVVLPQGQFQEFLKSEPGKRRKLLGDLLGLQVYEEMRREAEQRRAACQARREELEKRKQALAAATPEALMQLEAARRQAEEKTKHAAGLLPDLQARVEQLAGGRQLTIELEEKEAEWARLQAQEPGIQELRAAIQAAEKSERVLRFLELADRNNQECESKRQQLALAENRLSDLAADHANALRRLEEAREQARELDPLKARQVQLTAAIQGLVPRRNDLIGRRQANQQGLERLEQDLKAKKGARQAAGKRLEELEEAIRQTAAAQTALGYDPEFHARLEQASPAAYRLQNERQHLDRLTAEASVKAQELAQAQAAFAKAQARANLAAEQLRRIASEHQQSEVDLRNAERRQAATLLRQGLVAGEPCPVCRQPVPQVMDGEDHADLEVFQKREQGLRQELKAAEQAAQQARDELAAARLRGESAERTVASLQAAATDQEKLVARLAAELAPVVAGAAFHQNQDIGQAFMALRANCQELRHKYEALSLKLVELERNRAAIQREEASAARDTTGLETRLAAAQEAERQMATDLDKIERELEELCPAGEIEREAQKLALRCQNLETSLDSAHKQASAAATALAAQRGGVEEMRRQVQELAARADESAAAAAALLEQEGFASAAQARAAHLPEATVKEHVRHIRTHENAAHANQVRREELQRLLAGGRTSAIALREAEAARDEALGRERQAREEALRVSMQAETVRNQLAERGQVEKQLREAAQQEGMYHHLARDLRGDNFQQFLLTDTFVRLLEGASQRLLTLTRDRYGLDYDEGGKIQVVDHDNADARRSADTLSGGETFLASLALALELSEQVTRSAGAIQLDCLFIDEGFGSLDPEAMNLAVECTQGLTAGGRMVGVITHIPELKEAFSQRILVSKGDGSSRIHVERD